MPFYLLTLRKKVGVSAFFLCLVGKTKPAAINYALKIGEAAIDPNESFGNDQGNSSM